MQRDELAFIKNPAEWPRWPILPLKRGEETAVIFANFNDITGRFPFSTENIFEVIRDRKGKFNWTQEKTAEEIVAEGWRVD